jgi:hypothetical protein
MSEPLFAWQADGLNQPSRFVIEIKGDAIQMKARGPAVPVYVTDTPDGFETVFEPGNIAVVTFPLLEAAKLAQALLRCPPVQELLGKVPHVMWFDDDAQRDQFLARLEEKLREVGVGLPRVDLASPGFR